MQDVDLLHKTLPASLDAERTILGCALLDNDTFEQAAHALDAEMFYSPSHRKIFAAMQRLTIAGNGIDPITLQEELRKTDEIEQVGGLAYIASLFDGMPRF
jgi:replicative DNA helicase